MLYLIVTLVVILSVLLVIVVLVQDSKGGGFVGNISPNQMMGVKKTTDFLEQLTWGFAIGIMVLAVVSSFTLKNLGDDEDQAGSINVERAKEKTIAAPATKTVGPADASAPGDSGK